MISKNKQTSGAAKQSSKNKQTSKLSENAHFKSLLKAGFGVTAALILYQLYKRNTLLNSGDRNRHTPKGGWCTKCKEVEKENRFHGRCSNQVRPFRDEAQKRRYEKRL
jgi:hypothetical protein